jgi:cellulose synthase/poly-beta-1,6-N-acetylglucosamine synthase-like glycosyltransferase
MISVIIPALNSADTLPQQLRALSLQSDDAEYEVVVADNGSTDETAQVANDWRRHLALRVIDASSCKGPAGARNLGVRAARGALLAFTDADDIVLPGWLGTWANLSADVALATGPIVPFWDKDGPALSPPTVSAPSSHLGFLPYAFGANLAVRREAFERIGGFPEEYPAGEDVALSWRLQLAGVRLDFRRTAAVANRRKSALAQLGANYRYGRSDPFLCREFRPQGLPRSSIRPVMKSYLGIAARTPLIWNRQQRYRWSAQLGRRVGRLVGSLRAGAVCL